MDTPAHDVTTDTPVASTQPKRTSTVVAPEAPSKRPTSRSNTKIATDYLLDENRIGSIVHTPNKKRRYVQIRGEQMLTALAELYTSLFRQRWTLFARTVEKVSLTGTPATSHPQLLAQVYLSHWTMDVYRMIRESVYSLDPIAFNEKYHYQSPVHAQEYDHFLATLCDHLKPTHITIAYADEIYIPVLSPGMTDTHHNFFSWSKFILERDLFHLILQVFEEKKVVKMTPLSTDLFGRPSWLLDWSSENTAFAWFPQEANYSDEDVTVAYIIGVPCSPKLGHADFDDWKFVKDFPDMNPSRLQAYSRVTRRRWKASAEFRTAACESVHLPNYYESDEAKRKASNTGPLQIVDDVTRSIADTAQTSADAPTSTEMDRDYVPESPRLLTRARAREESEKIYRFRVIDYMYYRQVILQYDTTTRHTAFKLFIKA